MFDRLPRLRAALFTQAALVLSLSACQAPEIPPDPPTLTDDLEEPQNLPPVSGGTLLVTHDNLRAIAADPDYDRLWVVRIDTAAREPSITLQPGDEPGRLVEDKRGLVLVALRGASTIAVVDPLSGEVLERRPSCVWPRGLAYNEATDELHVACATGELQTTSAETGSLIRRLQLGPDLRDVVLAHGHLLVTRLKSAEVLSVDVNGKVVSTASPPEALMPVAASSQPESTFRSEVAWRAIAVNGEVLMAHQRAQDAPVKTATQGGYGEKPCGGIMHGAVTRFQVTEAGAVSAPAEARSMLGIALPVDVAVSSDGGQIAVAAAGNGQVMLLTPEDADAPATSTCGSSGLQVGGMPIGVAFADNELVIQTRSPSAILLPGRDISVQLGIAGKETGHQLFHHAPNGPIACASCHPDGREDGHVWTFAEAGPRRTQAMRMPLSDTLPLHWEGDMSDISAIMDEVFVHRMGGQKVDTDSKDAIATWLDGLSPLPPVRDPNDPAVERGKAVFERSDTACGTCHSGPLFTNNRNEDVGKGEALQVPSLLGVAWRLPLMHDGCAMTLRDRFDPVCGGYNHGNIGALSEGDIDDLVAYLESL